MVRTSSEREALARSYLLSLPILTSFLVGDLSSKSSITEYSVPLHIEALIRFFHALMFWSFILSIGFSISEILFCYTFFVPVAVLEPTIWLSIGFLSYIVWYVIHSVSDALYLLRDDGSFGHAGRPYLRMLAELIPLVVSMCYYVFRLYKSYERAYYYRQSRRTNMSTRRRVNAQSADSR